MTGQSAQDCVAGAIMQMLGRTRTGPPRQEANFRFIDLFAGIGGMRLGFESAGGPYKPFGNSALAPLIGSVATLLFNELKRLDSVGSN